MCRVGAQIPRCKRAGLDAAVIASLLYMCIMHNNQFINHYAKKEEERIREYETVPIRDIESSEEKEKEDVDQSHELLRI